MLASSTRRLAACSTPQCTGQCAALARPAVRPRPRAVAAADAPRQATLQQQAAPPAPQQPAPQQAQHQERLLATILQAGSGQQAAAQQPLAARLSVLPLVAETAPSLDEDAPWLEPGCFHEQFSLGETLGQGTYGTVRACTEAATGRQLAAKIVAKRKASEERLEAIAREVRTWRMLSHSPHIARLVGAYEDENNIYIVQELLTGGDLQSLLDAQGCLGEAEARAAMRGVLSALAACHDAGICYGDVKPSNFMLASNYPSVAHILDPSAPKGPMELRVIDFGCSQYCPDGCSLIQGLSGTPVFMAPEVVNDSCLSIAADAWAAGVMLYLLLTGRFPFWDCDMAGLGRIHPRKLLQDVRDGAQPLLDVPACEHLSPAAKELMAALLQRDPARRLTAAQALGHPWMREGGL